VLSFICRAIGALIRLLCCLSGNLSVGSLTILCIGSCIDDFVRQFLGDLFGLLIGALLRIFFDAFIISDVTGCVN
jgi:hypothetical protein